MGRPLNKKFFANTNYAKFGTSNVGGESIATINAVPNGLAGMTYLTGGPYPIAPADITAPQIAGGEKPVLAFQPTSETAGTVIIVSAGSGYTTAPSITVRGSLAGGAQTVTMTGAFDNVTLTSGATARQNGIKCEAQPAGEAEATTGDIIEQVSTTRYKVRVGSTTGICKLVTTASLNDGEMTITATDSNSNAYWVTKLTAHKATLTRKSVGSGNFATGTAVKWTFGSATSGTVSIENQ
jgi:hypothetical protein